MKSELFFFSPPIDCFCVGIPLHSGQHASPAVLFLPTLPLPPSGGFLSEITCELAFVVPTFPPVHRSTLYTTRTDGCIDSGFADGHGKPPVLPAVHSAGDWQTRSSSCAVLLKRQRLARISHCSTTRLPFGKMAETERRRRRFEHP